MRKCDGMTLMEVLAALLVLTLLVTAMGTSLDLMGRAENASKFSAESDALASSLQTVLADVLGFAENLEDNTFSNREYGIQKGSLCLEAGKLCVRETEVRPLLGSGIYGELAVTELEIQYVPEGQSADITRPDGREISNVPGGVFYITFRIENSTGLSRVYETAVRLVNP
jgi:prepilin-type N-terminal cleavage/methylation domain-containing protein